MASVSGFTAERMLQIESNTVIDGYIDSSGDLILVKKDGSTVNAGKAVGPIAGPEVLAAAQGFWMVYSEEPPEQTSMYNVPVVWIQRNAPLQDVPVLPQPPAWNDSNRGITVPNLIGVEYRLDGDVLEPLTQTIIPGSGSVVVTVTAVPKPGYTMSGSFSWTHQFIDYSTLTLYASDTFAGAQGQIVVGNAGSSIVEGRVFDMNLGGTASSPLKWVYANASEAVATSTHAMWVVNANNKASWSGNSNFDSSYLMADAGSRDMIVEFDILQFPISAHGPVLEFMLGQKSPNVSPRPLKGSIWVWASYKCNLTLNGVDTALGFLESSTPTNNPLTGHWKFTSIGKILTVHIPTGDSFSLDSTNKPDSDFGTFFKLNANFPSAGLLPVILDNIKVSRFV